MLSYPFAESKLNMSMDAGHVRLPPCLPRDGVAAICQTLKRLQGSIQDLLPACGAGPLWALLARRMEASRVRAGGSWAPLPRPVFAAFFWGLVPPPYPLFLQCETGTASHRLRHPFSASSSRRHMTRPTRTRRIGAVVVLQTCGCPSRVFSKVGKLHQVGSWCGVAACMPPWVSRVIPRFAASCAPAVAPTRYR